MLDLKGIFPAVTAFIAFIITLLCLFAGTQKNLLNNADLLTLYTPSSSASTPQTFYSVHVMSYCQGTVSTTEPGEGSVARNVTQCSNRTIPFAFNLTEALPAEISHGPNLDWARVISDDFHAFRTPSQSLTVLFIIGLGATGFALFARASSFISAKAKAQSGLFEFGFLVLGALSLSIGSITTTALAFEFVALINAHGDGSNVSAAYGDKFLGMSWASAGLLLVGSISSFINVFVRGGYEAPAVADAKDEEG